MIVHQFWHDEDAPYSVYREYLRFRYDTVLWTLDTVPAKLATLIKLIAGTVRPEDAYRHVANLVRYWVLNEYGGIWIDIDVIMLDDLTTYPLPFVAAHGNTACTCVMGFPSHHPSLQAAIDEVLGLPVDSEVSCVDVSGDKLLNKVITDEVTRHQLPFDAVGYPISSGSEWVIHLYQTTGKKCR